jgi:hypothetical protein
VRLCLSFFLLSTSVCLSGCATTTNPARLSPLQFSPPDVDIATGSSGRTRLGAVELIDRFLVEYRKAQSANADARQAFEVPAFIATLGAVAATAFGGGSNAVLAGGTANAALKGGNAYYAPKAKAAIYGNAHNAMTCIQSVALGAKPLEYEALVRNSLGVRGQEEDATIYYLIRNGALKADEILRTRLSNAGSIIDLASIAAEYETAVKKELDARAAAEKARDAAADARKGKGFMLSVAAGEDEKQRAALITELQEKIQQCVLRAKA